MAAEPFVLPLNGASHTLTPEALFYITFWILALPMFVAMMGIFLSRQIDLNIKVPNSVKLMLPLIYTGLSLTVSYTGLSLTVSSSFSYQAIFIFSAPIPTVLGFLQARLSYPEDSRPYTVAVVVAVVALRASTPLLYGYMSGFLVLLEGLLAYFFFLAYIYGRSSDSNGFFDSVLMPCLLITVIYSPLLLFLSFLLLPLF